MKLRRPNRFQAAALATFATICLSSVAHAATLTWDGNGNTAPNPNGGSGTWDVNSTAYWWNGTSNVVWPALGGTNDDAVFGNTAGTVTLGSAITANDLTFNTTGYILSGAFTLTLNGTTPTITTASGVTATIGNNTATVIDGMAGLTKAGVGTLTLNGSAVHTFTGGLTVNAGTLALNFANLATPTDLIYSGNALTLGGGTLSVTGKATGTTSQTFAGLTLNSGASAISLNSNGGTATNLVLGAITRNAGGLVNFTLPTAGSISTSSSNNAAGILGTWASVGSGASTKYATVSGGNITALSGTAAADGSGLTDITGLVNYDLAAGGGTVPATFSGNTIRYTGAIGTTAPGATSFTVNGLMNSGTGLWTIGTNALTIGSDKDLVVNTANNNIVISGVIKNNGGGASSLTKTSSGNLTLSASNTFTGGVTIAGGTLTLNNAGALNSTTPNAITLGVSGSNSPTLDLNGLTPTLASLTVGANVTNATINTNSWAANVSGVTTLNSPLRIVRYGSNTHEGIQTSGKVTGNGGGSGATTLTFEYAGSNNFYWQANNTVDNDFLGNIRATGGQIRLQVSTSAVAHLPTASMLIIDSGSTFSFSTGVTAETIDGLSGAGGINHINGSATLTLNSSNTSNDGNRLFTGAIGGGITSVTKTGTGSQEFSGASLNYSVATNLNNGTLKLTRTTAWNSNIAVGASNSPTLQLNTTLAGDATWTFAKQITGGSANAKIEKVGLGSVILTPAASSSFVGTSAGALTVTAGKLYLTSAFTTAPAISVAGGATFGSSITAGAITVADTGILANSNGTTGTAMTLTAGSLTFSNNGTLNVTLATTAGASFIPYNVTGALAVNGTMTVVPAVIPSSNGLYHLIQFGSSSVTASQFQFTSPVRAMSFQQNGSYIDINVNASNYPIWTGVGSTEWSTNTLTTKNWKLSSDGSGTDFLAADNVRFDDTAAGTTNVAINVADVSPATVTFDNTTKDYTVSGGFGIAGASLSKAGTGMLTITTANSYSGGSTLSGGRVRVGSNSALGTGSITFTGSSLSSDSTTARSLSNSIVLNAPTTFGHATDNGNLTLSGNLSGSGALTKVGSGVLALSGSNASYSGAVGIYAGTLALASAAALGTSNTITLGVNGATDPTLALTSPATMTIGALTVPAGVTGATIAMTQNSATVDFSVNGITLGSPLNINQSNASNPNWSQLILKSKITGTGGGSGNDTLVFTNTSGMQNYFSTDSGVVHDFLGNVRIKGGVVAVQSFAPAANQVIPDASMLWLEAGEWRWNSGGMVETIDGLRGAGTMNNTGNVTLTINSANTSNDGNRSFTGSLGTMGGALTKTGSGTQTLSGASITYTNATNVNGGTLILQGTTGFASSSISMGGGSVQFDDNGSAITYSGTITGSGGGFTKTGAGTLTLAGASSNSYSGPTTITNGRLDLNKSGGATAISGNLNFTGTPNWPTAGVRLLANEQIADTSVLTWTNLSGAIDFRLRGFTETVGGIQTSGTWNRDYAIIESGGPTDNPASGVDSALAVNTTGANSYFFDGQLRDKNDAVNTKLNFTKSGTGTQTLSGTRINYTGTTTVNDGVLTLQDATGFASSSIIMNGGTLEFNRSTGTQTFAQVIAAGTGTGGLLKSGAGTVVLTGANTYTGSTMVSEGKLVLDGSFTSTITSVASGATLGGSGTLAGTTTIQSGGFHSPGNSFGTQSFSNLTYNDGSIFSWDIDRTAAQTRGIGFDGVNVSGTLAGQDGVSDAAIFRVVIGDADFANTFWSTAHTWSDIFTSNGSTAIANWANIFGGGVQTYTSGGVAITDTATYGNFTLSGSTLTWSAVPEISNVLIGGLLGLGLLRRRRDR